MKILLGTAATQYWISEVEILTEAPVALPDTYVAKAVFNAGAATETFNCTLVTADMDDNPVYLTVGGC